jgi:hypothetical protein
MGSPPRGLSFLGKNRASHHKHEGGDGPISSSIPPPPSYRIGLRKQGRKEIWESVSSVCTMIFGFPLFLLFVPFWLLFMGIVELYKGRKSVLCFVQNLPSHLRTFIVRTSSLRASSPAVVQKISPFRRLRTATATFTAEKRKRRAARTEEEHKIAELRALIANPNASAYALNEAAIYCRNHFSDSYKEITKRILAHPNTPPQILLEEINRNYLLSPALFQNPILPLLPLEMPEFVGQLKPPVVEHIVRNESVPLAFARLLRTYPQPLLAWEAATLITATGEGNTEAWRDTFMAELKQRVFDETNNDSRALYYLLHRYGATPAWLDPIIAAWGDFWRDLSPGDGFPDVPPEVQSAAKEAIEGMKSHNVHHAFSQSDTIEQWAQPSSSQQNSLFAWGMDKNKFLAIVNGLLQWPGLSPLALQRLAHISPLVGIVALHHPHTDKNVDAEIQSLLLTALTKGYNLYFPFYLESQAEAIAAYLLWTCDSHLPPGIPWKYAKNSDFPRRLALAEQLPLYHPTHRRTLRKLTRDLNRYVRAAAQARFAKRTGR